MARQTNELLTSGRQISWRLRYELRTPGLEKNSISTAYPPSTGYSLIALTSEISMVVEAGYLRGADLWHLASALYLTPDPKEVTFITLDERQAEVARGLGVPGVEVSLPALHRPGYIRTPQHVVLAL